MSRRDIGAEIIAGLKEFRDSPTSLKRYEFAPADVRSIREQFAMTQKQFAGFLKISVRTLQKWEQGIRKPDGAAHALLRPCTIRKQGSNRDFWYVSIPAAAVIFAFVDCRLFRCVPRSFLAG